MNMQKNIWLSLIAPCLMAIFLLAHAPAALAAAPSFQAAGTPVNGTGSVTPAWPTHAVDDIALLIVESRGNEPVTLSTAAGFVEVTNSPQIAGTDTRLTVFWARATSTAMASPTVADPGNHVFAQIVTYRNVTPDAGDPWDVTGGGTKTTASTSVTVTGVTTTVNDTLIVQIVSRANDANGAAFSAQANANLTSLTERYDDGTNNGDGGGFVVWDGVLATAGATGNTTATVTSTTNAFLTIALKPIVGPAPPPGGSYSATQCAGSRFGSDLVCTANDVQITSISSVDGVTSCTAGDFLSMSFDVIVNAGTPDRWDIGIFFSNDGKDPQPLPANGGSNSCSVTVLPTTAPFLNLDPGPHSGQIDSCGDVNGSMNPGLIGPVDSANKGIHRVNNVTVKCQAKSGSGGNLWVPFVLSWDNQGSPTGKLCQSNLDPVPNTKSKCNAPTVQQATVVGVVVLPKIEKSDGITVIDQGQVTNYSIVITNNTGDTISSATFTDPAVANLTVNSVTCAASGGATCPATGTNSGDLSVANMQGAGVTITSMPAGSALTFTVNATTSSSVADGTLITNTASVTTNGQTNSASDTNTVGSTELDHYELSLATSSVACEPSTVTVTACAGAVGSSPCTNIYSNADVNDDPVTVGVASTTGGATLANPTPTFTTGVASTTLSYTTAINGNTATVSLANTVPSVPKVAPNGIVCCQGGSCTVGSSCTTTFMRDALFIANTSGGGAANIPHQTAGIKSGQFYVRAVKTLSGGGCDNALRGSANIEFAYECNNPGTCYSTNNMKIETIPVTTITNNNSGSVGASAGTYTSVPMNFDNAGYASFYLTYEDVGLVTLHTKYTSGSLYGASNAFVVKPYRFLLSNISCSGAGCVTANNPAAALPTDAAFVKAGSPFSVTVTAVAANMSNATPAYGRETPNETVKLTPTLVAPNFSGTSNPAIENATAFAIPFSGGTSTGTTFAWSEVGIIKLMPSVGDGNYLAAGDVIGNETGNVGRFIPHHFKVTDTPGCGSIFTYSGQSFSATATAQALGNSTTRNYTAPPPPAVSPVFARDTTFTDADDTYTATCSNNTMLAANYSAGVGTLSGIVCTFQNKDSPMGITLRAAEPVGSDGVTSADGSAGNGNDNMDLRSGRMRLFNVHGSELQNLTMPVWIEYYSTLNDGWLKNTADTCTASVLAHLDLQNNVENPAQATATITTRSPKTTTVTVNVAAPTNGTGSLLFSAPGPGGYGYADARMDLTSQSWLKYYWNGGSESDPGCTTSCVDPTGRATFGTYRGNPRHIHLRELY